jgi:hypothetical protein
VFHFQSYFPEKLGVKKKEHRGGSKKYRVGGGEGIKMMPFQG